MLRQSLSQKMLQKLSPQQIQLMKLLQLPTGILEQRIKEELEINPALEEGGNSDDNPDFDANNNENTATDSEYDDAVAPPEDKFEMEGDYLNNYMDDDEPSYKYKDDNYGGDEEDKSTPIAVEQTFHDNLEQQLGLWPMESEKEAIIAHQIIGSIDEDGYLRREPSAIIDDLMFLQNIMATEDEVLAVLKKIQRFDPPGVGARDLQECLCIQLKLKQEQEETKLSLGDQHILLLAIEIVEKNFDAFSKKHYDRLQKKLEVPEDDLKEAIDEITKLNPKPASGFVGSYSQATQYVVPDFIILNRDGELELTLNTRNAPDLRVSDYYREMLRDYKKSAQKNKATRQDKEAVMFIKQKIDSAKWFIDAIRQRQDTMYHTMYAILQYQYDYFLSGDPKKMRPMILKDIAEITGLDISTVSRVVNSKFVQTEFGTHSLKAFFSESLSTQDGEEVSTLEVKKILEEVIGKEDKRKPLSDEHLKDILQERGYNIARRTVAKYREQLNIPVARLRKEL
ncbi:MAG TPA: RNA polymerase factor sigma-54 [Saprospiraceae bacterium]|nr:RNA polymerase factor sigma-54 [Saprospiraceae bacterium]HMQ85000.1 RNA polymerase factor sigma-54 [Saprospiraceae bacterium]